MFAERNRNEKPTRVEALTKNRSNAARIIKNIYKHARDYRYAYFMLGAMWYLRKAQAQGTLLDEPTLDISYFADPNGVIDYSLAFVENNEVMSLGHSCLVSVDPIGFPSPPCTTQEIVTLFVSSCNAILLNFQNTSDYGFNTTFCKYYELSSANATYSSGEFYKCINNLLNSQWGDYCSNELQIFSWEIVYVLAIMTVLLPAVFGLPCFCLMPECGPEGIKAKLISSVPFVLGTGSILFIAGMHVYARVYTMIGICVIWDKVYEEGLLRKKILGVENIFLDAILTFSAFMTLADILLILGKDDSSIKRSRWILAMFASFSNMVIEIFEIFPTVLIFFNNFPGDKSYGAGIFFAVIFALLAGLREFLKMTPDIVKDCHCCHSLELLFVPMNAVVLPAIISEFLSVIFEVDFFEPLRETKYILLVLIMLAAMFTEWKSQKNPIAHAVASIFDEALIALAFCTSAVYAAESEPKLNTIVTDDKNFALQAGIWFCAFRCLYEVLKAYFRVKDVKLMEELNINNGEDREGLLARR